MKYSAGTYSVTASTTTTVKTSQQLQGTLGGQSSTLKVWNEQ
jgi:hypothetical protein